MPRKAPTSRATAPARFVRSALLLFASVAAFAGRARAADDLKHGQLVVMPGVSVFDSRQQYGGHDLGAAPSLEARLGLLPTRAVRFELAGGFASATPSGGGSSVSMSHVALELAPQFDLPWKFGVAPFLGLGHQSYGRAEDVSSSTG